MDDKAKNLADLLTQLPVSAPLFLPDEILAIWFPPWRENGMVNSDSLEAAQPYGERFGCVFTHDANLDEWCYTKQRTN
ncbi:MAG: hypothetical protein JO056_06400 [Alphaproteobacteria bacterium]|uniref:hypothetical protein n=1 Tax=Bradyrhizobium sp. TaxID=376 RepID=UPI001EB17B90|nr:hypothetical protein [Bradyrhizobium sp.]MBV9570852.1 hypothetical protein [Alphaproteobacteria bacterium]MBV9979102.1 hypothetical protein [Bradyrhizobium sp.]